MCVGCVNMQGIHACMPGSADDGSVHLNGWAQGCNTYACNSEQYVSSIQPDAIPKA